MLDPFHFEKSDVSSDKYHSRYENVFMFKIWKNNFRNSRIYKSVCLVFRSYSFSWKKNVFLLQDWFIGWNYRKLNKVKIMIITIIILVLDRIYEVTFNFFIRRNKVFKISSKAFLLIVNIFKNLVVEILCFFFFILTLYLWHSLESFSSWINS